MMAEPRPVLPAPAQVADLEPRCWRCGRMLAWLLTRPWKLRCNRCHATNASVPG